MLKNGLRAQLALMILVLIAGAGCQATFTNLTASSATRNANNLYPVEVALNTRQRTLLWSTIHPTVVVGQEAYTLRPTPLMTNRWEGVIPVSASTNLTHYHFKFDFDYNKFGSPGHDSAASREFVLRIRDKAD